MNNPDGYGLNYFDKLIPENESCEQLSSGAAFKRTPYSYVDKDGDNFINIYSVEIQHGNRNKFGIKFSQQGNYCVELAREAESMFPDRIICSMNCNFGLIVDEHDRMPYDTSFNLHIEDGNVVQLPVADKTALLISFNGDLQFDFCNAKGFLQIGQRKLKWVGSLTKQSYIADDVVLVYNSFNRKLKQVHDKITTSRRKFDTASAYTPKDKSRVDLVVRYGEQGLIVSEVNQSTQTHLFAGHMIFSVPISFMRYIKQNDVVSNISLDGLQLDRFRFGVTVGSILTRNRLETENNIERSTIIQTRTEMSDKPVFQVESKYCRACIISTPDKIIFLLIDARKLISGQEGVTITKLREIIECLYPDYLKAVNVDGGHAAKLIIRRDNTYDVFGNLHYKKWPKSNSEKFEWNGYLGRKVPAIIYLYQ